MRAKKCLGSRLRGNDGVRERVSSGSDEQLLQLVLEDLPGRVARQGLVPEDDLHRHLESREPARDPGPDLLFRGLRTGLQLHDRSGLLAENLVRNADQRRIQRAAMEEQPGDQWSKLATVAATLVAYQLSAHGPLLRTSALTALPESMRHQMMEGSNRVSDRFAAIIADGIAYGSVRAVDPFIAAQMLTATLNVSATIDRWFPGVSRDEAIALHGKPMLLGIFSD